MGGRRDGAIFKLCVNAGFCQEGQPQAQIEVKGKHLVDAGHHGKDGGVWDERRVQARLRQAPRQLLAPVPRRALRHHHLRQRHGSSAQASRCI